MCTFVLSFAGGSSARVRLPWDEAPKTVSALLSLCGSSRRVSDVNAVHARHSGAKALFLTPFVLRDVGDENLEPASRCGDVLFAFEPKSICNHEDASEVAWLSTMMPAFRVAGPGLGRR